MRVLLVGSGAREHALAWAISQSPLCEALFITPGNPGTARLGQNLPGSLGEPGSLVAAAKQARADLVVVGPETPLVLGAADLLRAQGFAVCGPSALAAEIEGSKAWSKEFMRRHHIPTAAFGVFDDFDKARAYIESSGGPLVVKADGLVAGKGVFVCDSPEEAIEAARALLERKSLGAAGLRVVIEERLPGRELSVFALSDGKECWLLPSARDHKTLYEGGRGPMTGGMGAFSPVAEATPELLERIHREVLAPTLAGMAKEGRPFVGFLFAGLMLTPKGPYVLEFNCRLGDPETQCLVPRAKFDWLCVLHRAATGTLPPEAPENAWSDEVALGVVLAAHGYPGEVRRGDEIHGIDEAEREALVFHAGTAIQEGRLVTAGGRVLSVVGRGATQDQARARAYSAAAKISFDGKQQRGDIGASSQVETE
jgi:phosphoribosylamine--glycine ligase